MLEIVRNRIRRNRIRKIDEMMEIARFSKKIENLAISIISSIFLILFLKY